MRPIQTEPDTSEQTAEFGDLLFVQDFAAARTAVLPQGLQADIPGLFGRRPGIATFAADATLLEVSQPGAPIVFCDPAVTYHPTSGSDRRRLRFCAVDRDGDQAFEMAYWCITNGQPFTPMMSPLWRDLASPIPYEAAPATARLLSAGLVVSRSPLGAYRLRFAVSEDGPPTVLTISSDGAMNAETRASGGESVDARTAYFRASDTPLTVTSMGAAIEILSVGEGAVRYRVISTFDPETTVRIAVDGDLPRAHR